MLVTVCGLNSEKVKSKVATEMVQMADHIPSGFIAPSDHKIASTKERSIHAVLRSSSKQPPAACRPVLKAAFSCSEYLYVCVIRNSESHSMQNVFLPCIAVCPSL
jgi:hypothetical protein